MIEKIFPKTVDNDYQGSKFVKWVLYLIVFKSFFASIVHIFTADGGAQSIGNIALDQLSEGGSDTIITLFAYWGLEQLIIGIIALIVVLRYKSLIPFIWLIYTIDYSARLIIPLFKPELLVTAPLPGTILDYVLAPLAILMFILALYYKKEKS